MQQGQKKEASVNVVNVRMEQARRPRVTSLQISSSRSPQLINTIMRIYTLAAGVSSVDYWEREDTRKLALASACVCRVIRNNSRCARVRVSLHLACSYHYQKGQVMHACATWIYCYGTATSVDVS